MTNSGEVDLLDQLTNPQLVAKAEAEQQRSSFRPKWTHVIADIDSVAEPYEVRLNNGNMAKRTALKLSNVQVLALVEGSDPIYDDTLVLELGLPTRASHDSEIYQMVASATKVDKNIDSIRKMAGLKGVELLERTHKYKGRRPTEVENPETMLKEQVWNEVELTTYYYSVVKIGGGKAAVSTEPTVDGLKAALELLKGDGMTENAFGLAAIKVKAINSDGALVKQIADGSFIKDAIAQGSVVKEGEVLKLVEA